MVQSIQPRAAAVMALRRVSRISRRVNRSQ